MVFAAVQARIRHTFRSAVPVRAFVTAIAADPDGNTSEFSKCVKVERA
ncbi:MAG TPA: hypothetical protein VGX21_16125 [Methylomirabilota bacterium]|nr:hypothetical protein [Methylomirabilota bacterium]